MKNSFTAARTLLLAASLLFGTSAAIDLVDDNAADVVSIEQTLQHPNKEKQNDSSDAFEASAKGAVTVVSLFLFYYTQDKKLARQIVPAPIAIELPFIINTNNISDKEASHYFQRESNRFIAMIKDKIPDYLTEAFDITDLEIRIENGHIEIDVFVHVVEIKGREDLTKLVLHFIKKHSQDLFQEKLQRIGREMINTSHFPQTVARVVSQQFDDIQKR